MYSTWFAFTFRHNTAVGTGEWGSSTYCYNLIRKNKVALNRQSLWHGYVSVQEGSVRVLIPKHIRLNTFNGIVTAMCYEA